MRKLGACLRKIRVFCLFLLYFCVTNLPKPKNLKNNNQFIKLHTYYF